MLLDPIPRATGGKFWESKQQRAFRFHFLVCPACQWRAERKNPFRHPLTQTLCVPLLFALLGCSLQLSVPQGQTKHLLLLASSLSRQSHKLPAASLHLQAVGGPSVLSSLLVYQFIPGHPYLDALMNGSQANICIEQDFFVGL